MARSVKKRSEHETVVTLRLPRELHALLKKEADATGRGFAAEVRHRLEAGISQGTPQPNNAQVRDFLNAALSMVGYLGSEITRSLDEFAVFKRAIEMLLRAIDPTSQPNEPSVQVSASALAHLGVGDARLPDRDRLMGRLVAIQWGGEKELAERLKWEKANEKR
jgi:hypothetical protein